MLKLGAPGSRWYTIFILILFAGLLVYGFVKGDPIVYFILPILLIFFGLPLLLLYMLNRCSHASTSGMRNGEAAGGEGSALDDDPSRVDDRDSPDANN